MEGVKFKDSPISKSIAELLVQRDQKTLAMWAADCAEHVLHCFETKRSHDVRPREAIEAGRAWAHGEISMSKARSAAFAAHAAARDAADHTAASATARAAGHAAATAHVAGHAVHAATYAAKAAAYSTGPANAAETIDRERNWQFQHLLSMRRR